MIGPGRRLLLVFNYLLIRSPFLLYHDAILKRFQHLVWEHSIPIEEMLRCSIMSPYLRA